MILTKIILLPLLTGTLLFASSGAFLYKKHCKSCHGEKGEKKALGKSKAIKGMSVASIEKDMHDYVTGKKKAVPMAKKMKKDFMKKHNNKEDLRAVSKYIHGL